MSNNSRREKRRKAKERGKARAARRARRKEAKADRDEALAESMLLDPASPLYEDRFGIGWN